MNKTFFVSTNIELSTEEKMLFLDLEFSPPLPEKTLFYGTELNDSSYSSEGYQTGVLQKYDYPTIRKNTSGASLDLLRMGYTICNEDEMNEPKRNLVCEKM